MIQSAEREGAGWYGGVKVTLLHSGRSPLTDGLNPHTDNGERVNILGTLFA